METLDKFFTIVTPIIPEKINLNNKFKRCWKCGKTKPLSEFSKDITGKFGCGSRCKTCDNIRLNERRLRYKLVIDQIKLTTGCIVCGYNQHPKALHLHHWDKKTFPLSSGRTYSKTPREIMDEINSCMVLCANCHSLIPDAKHK